MIFGWIIHEEMHVDHEAEKHVPALECHSDFSIWIINEEMHVEHETEEHVPAPGW